MYLKSRPAAVVRSIRRAGSTKTIDFLVRSPKAPLVKSVTPAAGFGGRDNTVTVTVEHWYVFSFIRVESCAATYLQANKSVVEKQT